MLPELWRIPWLNVPILTYGLLLTVAMIVGIWLSGRLAATDGIPENRIYNLAFWSIPAALIGTRLLMNLALWRALTAGWRQDVSIGQLHFIGHYLGGLIAALLVSAIVVRAWRMSWFRLADSMAPALALGNVFGRIGCFAAGCCWGVPTDSWFGVRFTERAHVMSGTPINVALLPTQLYEAAANLVMFTLLLLLWKRRAFYGQIILSYLMLYSIERFVTEFWRADPRGEVMNFSISQFISLLLFPIALSAYVWRRRKAESGQSVLAGRQIASPSFVNRRMKEVEP